MRNGNKGLSRREFLKTVGLGALGTAVAGGISGGLASKLLTPLPAAQAATATVALAATDGYITMPGRSSALYIFGFRRVDGLGFGPNPTVAQLGGVKGHTQHTAPILNFLQNDDMKVTLSNLGLVQRPDLFDSHTIHWHGFDLPTPLYDGVPEVSIAVPIGKQVTYFYRPHREGTYMYHCHFEDVEHVQMGMTSIVFVRPLQDNNGTLRHVGASRPAPNNVDFQGFAYNDGDGTTGYDRHFAILLNDIDERQHDADRDIQLFVPTDYQPQYFTLNGRVYPQTIMLNDDATTSSGLTTTNPNYGTADASQPNSSLIQVNPGERILLRLANLGYTIDAMQLPGIPMHVVGQDASLLRNGTTDVSYWTNTLYLGPGEARDVLFDAPAYDGSRPSGSDGRGSYNVYYFKNRDWRKLSNHGLPGPGGMMTEVRVYQTRLPAQTFVNQTYA